MLQISFLTHPKGVLLDLDPVTGKVTETSLRWLLLCDIIMQAAIEDGNIVAIKGRTWSATIFK